MQYKTVTSINEYIEFIEKDTENWQYNNEYGCPWFRGQPKAMLPPRPSVFRDQLGEFDEFNLTRAFRERSSTIADTPPDRNDIDKWLFLMQHNKLPTRLLDWTEGSLIALFFAVNTDEKTDRAVWMIHPLELNYYSIGEKDLPNTWTLNSGSINFNAAFNRSHPYEIKNESGQVLFTESILPVAVPTFYCHTRMFAQKSCFTVHGSDKRDFESLFCNHDLINNGYFIKYVIPNDASDKIKNELKVLGITYSSVYPDLEGLAKELGERFFRYREDTGDIPYLSLEGKSQSCTRPK